jgi:hypothetical protein
MEQYEKVVPDYNFGTILRQDATREYAEDNSMLVTRTQFYAIEVSLISCRNNGHSARRLLNVILFFLFFKLEDCTE